MSALVAQWLERWSYEPNVDSSNLSWSTLFIHRVFVPIENEILAKYLLHLNEIMDNGYLQYKLLGSEAIRKWK